MEVLKDGDQDIHHNKVLIQVHKVHIHLNKVIHHNKDLIQDHKDHIHRNKDILLNKDLIQDQKDHIHHSKVHKVNIHHSKDIHHNKDLIQVHKDHIHLNKDIHHNKDLMDLFHHIKDFLHIMDFLLMEVLDLKQDILQKEVLVQVMLNNHHKDIHLKVDILPNMEDIKISQFQNQLMNIL